MTATPIPRTLALTTYGDLDVSVMREMPPGRQPIATTAQAGVAARRDLRVRARARSTQGRQAYVIYPLVEESEKVDLKAATEMADHLAQDVFPELPRRAAARPAEAGREGSRDGRVRARRVRHPRVDDGVEVGVDVPNATVMVVEHAERFGLSQLHQLRGRVGRGAHKSYCVLLYQSPLTDQGTRAAEGADRHDRRLRDRRARSAAARPRRLLRHAPVRACRRCASATCCATTR